MLTGHGPPPKPTYQHPGGGGYRKVFAGTRGHLPPRGRTLQKTSLHPPPKRGTLRDQVQASAHPGHLSGHAPPPSPRAHHAAEGGTWCQILPVSLGHSPYGGGGRKNPPPNLVNAHPGHQLHQHTPPTARLTAEGGNPWKSFSGPPRYSQSGRGNPSKMGGAPPQSRKCSPGPSARLSERPPEQSALPGLPPLACLVAEGGDPWKSFCRAPYKFFARGPPLCCKACN